VTAKIRPKEFHVKKYNFIEMERRTGIERKRNTPK